MLDLQACKFVNVLAPVSVAGGGTAAATDVDTKNFRAGAFLIQSGTIPATGVATLKWQESDVAAGPFADIPGASHTALVTADGTPILCTFMNFKGRKRFVRLILTNGATNPTVLAALAILYRAEEFPDTLAERALKEQLFV